VNNKVTIIMYHYVRDLKSSRFPEIKGLSIESFKEQLEYLQKHYCLITMEHLMRAMEGVESLPKKPALLTFDDAYIDHFTNVFPILIEKNLQGSFFPPVKAITRHEVLDVNKIHFILASTDKNSIIKSIFAQLDKYRNEYKLKSNEYYYKKLAKSNHFDTKEIIFIKRILQKELGEKLRKKMTNHLFEKFVGIEERIFSKELYMSFDQIKCLKRNGMHIGNHGFDHYWLSSLTKEQQENEINLSLDFLRSVGADASNWTMCYPYGDYNKTTTDILKLKGCKLALTTVVDIADISNHNRFELPRLDTNNIPKQKDATINEWHKNG
jgi:peptidoglycan/xylan/chitin deacetylase (PgdA/CDA1 family)